MPITTLTEYPMQLGECPRWDVRTQTLYWVDIPAKRFYRCQLASKIQQFIELPAEVGCFALCENGGFILGMKGGFALLSAFDSATLQFIADPEADKPHNRLNDGRCDQLGRFWASSVYPPKDKSDAWLYCLSQQRVTRHAGPVMTGNGLAFSPDYKHLYWADTPAHLVWVFDYDQASGQIHNQRVFHQFEQGNGRPDGAAIDAEGFYWTALYAGGRVVRLDPTGRLVQEIQLPALNITMPCFGGSDFKTLFITTASTGMTPSQQALYPLAGHIFSLQLDVAGLAEPEYIQ